MRSRKALSLTRPRERVQGRLARWRRSRRSRSRIPEALWLEVVDVARKNGLNRTARALGLDYYSLKKRLATAESAACGERPAAGFVELLAREGAGAQEWVLEFESVQGAKLKVQLKGSAVPELTALSQVFWNQAS